MHHVARGGLLLLLAFCAPAWGTGFCDTLPGHGTGCSQIRSTEVHPVSGAILPAFSDLDLQADPIGSEPIGFVLDFSALDVAEGTRAIVLELGFAGTLPDSRMLTMSVTKNVGYTLRFDWLRAAPSWSSVGSLQTPPTIIQSISSAIPASETSVAVVLSPSDPAGEDIFVGGEYAGNFEFPVGAASHHAVRLRTGVIGGHLYKGDMTTHYAFLSPSINE